MVTELRNSEFAEGQGKSSIAPTFSKRGYNYRIYIRFRCCLCWLQGGCTEWIINQGFLIAHRVWVSDILFHVFHEKVI